MRILSDGAAGHYGYHDAHDFEYLDEQANPKMNDSYVPMIWGKLEFTLRRDKSFLRNLHFTNDPAAGQFLKTG